MKKIKQLLKRLFCKAHVGASGKLINSVVAVGDVIEVEWNGKRKIYKVEKFEVILNSPHVRPIDWVIHVKLSHNNGISSIECTSDNFKYVRHVSHCR